MTHSIPYFLKLYKFPFLMGATLLISSAYVYTQLQIPAAAPLPPVPKQSSVPQKKQPAKAAASKVQPQRDPFRPLNHPPQTENQLEKEKILPPSHTNSSHLAAAPAQTAPLSYRFSGIMTVNGHKKALVMTPDGSLLLGEGETLPGKGTIQGITENTLQCRGIAIQLGEKWS